MKHWWMRVCNGLCWLVIGILGVSLVGRVDWASLQANRLWPLLLLPLAIAVALWALRRQRLPSSEAVAQAPALEGSSLTPALAPPANFSKQGSARARVPWLNLGLFAATLLTTVWAGALHQGINLLAEPARFAVGLPYALALLAILGVHELGHYVVARRHGLDVSWPYFIPVPLGLGTFGAFIRVRSAMKSRRAVFDVGIAGPLAGLLVALPLLLIGLRQSTVAVDGAGVDSGGSLLLALLAQVAHGGELGGLHLQLSPLAFAGWIGLLVTALNLLPVGQLDGGHIAYGLLGRRYARWVGIGTLGVMVVLGLTIWPGLLMWALLVFLLTGIGPALALDELAPPGRTRVALGLMSLLLLVLIVTPLPGSFQGFALDCPYT